MQQDRLLRIANRINLLLLRELGQGIDVERMLKQPRYARDVLLVCDARPGSTVASLALHFRQARSAQGDEQTRQASPRPARPDPSIGALRVPPAARLARPWFSPARWIGLA